MPGDKIGEDLANELFCSALMSAYNNVYCMTLYDKIMTSKTSCPFLQGCSKRHFKIYVKPTVHFTAT